MGDLVSIEKQSKSSVTRNKILRAFDVCLTDLGYAQTKLVDIAEAAGLATPHLRYYFKNKESILEHRFERQVADFDRVVNNLPAQDPLQWFEGLAKMVFGTDPRTTQALLVLVEGNVLVARSEQMRMLKQSYDRKVRDAMEQQLRNGGVSDSKRQARILFHFLSGLILNTALEPKSNREDATPLFLDLVRQVLAK